MTKVIPIADKKDFYNQIITLMNMTVDLNLIPTEIKVLALLYTERDILTAKGLSEKDVCLFLFSSSSRKKMRDELNMSYSVYNNLISSLRNHKDMIDDKTLHPFFTKMSKFKDNVFNLTFQFKLDGSKE